PTVLVLVRRADDAVHVLLGGQRHGADHPRASARHGVHDLPRARVDRLVVVGLEPDADLLSRHRVLLVFRMSRLREDSDSAAARCSVCCAVAPDPRIRGHRTANYLLILVTRPAPTVRPPSRMAKRRPSSIAIGWMSDTDISVLSPGMTISVP